MKKYYILALATSLAALTGCEDEVKVPPVNDVTELTAVINGAQQVPANSSTADGTFTGRYTSSTKQLVYTVTYKGMTPTVAHIHRGAPGTNSSVDVPFANLTSPITGTVTLSAEQADLLLSNRMYVNIHSAPPYGGGEIRGDIKKK